MTSVHYEIRRSSPGSSIPDLLGDTALNPWVLHRLCSPAPGSTRISKDNKAEYSEIEEVLTLEAITVAVRNCRIQTHNTWVQAGGWNKTISFFFFLHRFLGMFRLLKLQKLMGVHCLWGSAVQPQDFFDRHIPVHLLSLGSLLSFSCRGKAVYSVTFPDKGTTP